MAGEQSVRRVAVALFDGFTVLDVYGPVQAFASCRIMRPGPVAAGEGVSTVAEYAFADAPSFDVLVIPGGFGTRRAVSDQGFMEYVWNADAANDPFA